MTHKIQKEKNSKIELEVTIDAKDFMALWDKGFKIVQSEIEMDGFRKGNAPESAIIAKYGEQAILTEMANIAINESYPKIMIEESKKGDIRPIAEPHIHIISMERDKDMVYHAHVPVYPTVDLGDYMSIAHNAKRPESAPTDATDEELAKVLEQLDEQVKSETPDLENKIRENIKLEKESIEKSKHRSSILEELIKSIETSGTDMWPEGFTDKDKAQIIILEIAKDKKLEASTEEVDAELMKLMMYMHPSELEQNKLDEIRMKNYAEQIIINEKVLAMLETA